MLHIFLASLLLFKIINEQMEECGSKGGPNRETPFYNISDYNPKLSLTVGVVHSEYVKSTVYRKYFSCTPFVPFSEEYKVVSNLVKQKSLHVFIWLHDTQLM